MVRELSCILPGMYGFADASDERIRRFLATVSSLRALSDFSGQSETLDSANTRNCKFAMVHAKIWPSALQGHFLLLLVGLGLLFAAPTL